MPDIVIRLRHSLNNKLSKEAADEIDRLRALLREIVNIDCKECRSAAIAVIGRH